MHSPTRRLFLAILVIALLPRPAAGQLSDANAIHWAYSTYFGTGWYRINDARDAFVIRYAPRMLVREKSVVDDNRSYEIEVRIPITIGLNQFPLDDLRGTVDFDNLANISVTPSVNVQIPVSDRWSLRPFAAVGWGTVLNGDESAWTYWAGIRSRYTFAAGKLHGSLINSIGVVGYSPSNGPSSDFWPIMGGLEFAYPLGEHCWQGEQMLLNWHVAYSYFADNLEVLQGDLTTAGINDQWELGLAVSKKETPIEIWRFRFDRLGLAYRFSSDGELKGIGFVFRSLFDL